MPLGAALLILEERLKGLGGSVMGLAGFGGRGMCHSSVQRLEGRAIAEKRVTLASESQAAKAIIF